MTMNPEYIAMFTILPILFIGAIAYLAYAFIFGEKYFKTFQDANTDQNVNTEEQTNEEKSE